MSPIVTICPFRTQYSFMRKLSKQLRLGFDGVSLFHTTLTELARSAELVSILPPPPSPPPPPPAIIHPVEQAALPKRETPERSAREQETSPAKRDPNIVAIPPASPSILVPALHLKLVPSHKAEERDEDESLTSRSSSTSVAHSGDVEVNPIFDTRSVMHVNSIKPHKENIGYMNTREGSSFPPGPLWHCGTVTLAQNRFTVIPINESSTGANAILLPLLPPKEEAKKPHQSQPERATTSDGEIPVVPGSSQFKVNGQSTPAMSHVKGWTRRNFRDSGKQMRLQRGNPNPLTSNQGAAEAAMTLLTLSPQLATVAQQFVCGGGGRCSLTS